MPVIHQYNKVKFFNDFFITETITGGVFGVTGMELASNSYILDTDYSVAFSTGSGQTGTFVFTYLTVGAPDDVSYIYRPNIGNDNQKKMIEARLKVQGKIEAVVGFVTGTSAIGGALFHINTDNSVVQVKISNDSGQTFLHTINTTILANRTDLYFKVEKGDGQFKFYINDILVYTHTTQGINDTAAIGSRPVVGWIKTAEAQAGESQLDYIYIESDVNRTLVG